MKENFENSSESLVPMEDMINVPASFIEELRTVIKRLKKAEDNCITLLQSPPLLSAVGELIFVNIAIACTKVEEIVKEYDAHIEDKIDNFVNREL